MTHSPAAAAPMFKAAPATTQGELADDARAELIRQTAYSYYEARGRSGGHELDDWLKAEAEVVGKVAGPDAGSSATDTTH